MNSYLDISKVKSIILKDANATKFTIGVKGVSEFRKRLGAASDPGDPMANDYDVEVYADGLLYTMIAREYIAAVLFKEGA